MKNKLGAKLSYACGDIYGGGAFMIFSLLFMNFLVLVEGVSVVAATIIIFIGKLWDAVTDPVMGRISDKTRSRFGRRRLYFLLGIIPVYLSFVMLFYSFGIQNSLAKIIYFTFSYMFFGTAFTIVMIPYNAILSDITSDYNERTSFTTARMIMSGAASLLSAVIPSIIIKLVGSETISPAQKPGYLVMALIFGAVFGIAWLITFLGTREQENLPDPEKMTLKMWLSVFKNKAYRNFLGIFLPFQITVDLVLALFIFYIDIVILQYRNYELVVGLLLVCSMLFVPVMGAIAQRKGKVFPMYIGVPIWMISTLTFIWLGSGVPVVVLCVLAVLIATGTSSGQLATWSMLTDIFDIDELCTGKRREGVYSGMTTFLRKFGSGVAILLIGFGLKAFGFDQNEYTVQKALMVNFNPTEYAKSNVVFGIKWMFVVIPIVLLAICLVFVIRNKINKRRFDSVLKGISEFKAHGNISGLTEKEANDVVIATGVASEKLWGGGQLS